MTNSSRFKRIIILTGKIASGKTTISNILADNYQYPYVTISQFLKNELVKEGKPITRENLQNFGKRIFAEFGEDYIIEKTLSLVPSENDVCILDGIRYPEGIDIIKEKYAEKCYTIYLDIESEIRYSRYQPQITKSDWDEINNSFTESNIEKIKDKADCIFNSTLDIKHIIKYIKEYIEAVENLNVEFNSSESKQFKVSCVGQLTEDHYCHVDRIPSRDQFANINEEFVTYGGNSANMAYWLSKQGCTVTFYTQTSKEFPVELLQNLQKDISHLVISNYLEHHPLCFMYYTGTESVNFYGFSGSYKQETISLPKDSDLILVSGDVTLTNNALNGLKKIDKVPLVCWNPGYETRFLDAHQVRDFLELADIIILSEIEYLHIQELCNNLIKQSKILILTKGAFGSLLVTEGMRMQFPVLKSEVINSFGAGDCFTAAFTYMYLASANIIASIKYATEMATLPLQSHTSKG